MAKFVAVVTVTDVMVFDAPVPAPKVRTLKRSDGRDVHEMTNENAVLKARGAAGKEALRLAKLRYPKARSVVVQEVGDA